MPELQVTYGVHFYRCTLCKNKLRVPVSSIYPRISYRTQLKILYSVRAMSPYLLICGICKKYEWLPGIIASFVCWLFCIGIKIEFICVRWYRETWKHPVINNTLRSNLLCRNFAEWQYDKDFNDAYNSVNIWNLANEGWYLLITRYSNIYKNRVEGTTLLRIIPLQTWRECSIQLQEFLTWKRIVCSQMERRGLWIWSRQFLIYPFAAKRGEL